MIKKYVIFANPIYLASTPPSFSSQENVRCIELQLPTEEFWELEKILEHLYFLDATSTPASALYLQKQKIFKFIRKYATEEKVRDEFHQLKNIST